MKKAIATLLILTGLAVVFHHLYPTVTLRYRISVDVDYDGNRRLGSSVVQVSYSRVVPLFGSSLETVSSVRGEAILIDLGRSSALLVLLGGREGRFGAPEALIPAAFNGTPAGPGVADFPRLRNLSGARTVPPEMLPAVAFLLDREDPKSAAKVVTSDRASLTPPIKLISATIEIVDPGIWPFNSVGLTGTPITSILRKNFAWLDDERSLRLFWRGLLDAGIQVNASIEPRTLLIRED